MDFRLSNIQNQKKMEQKFWERELGSQEYYVQSNCYSNTKAIISCHIWIVIVPTSWGLVRIKWDVRVKSSIITTKMTTANIHCIVICVRYCSMYFTCILSFTHSNNPIRKYYYYSHCTDEEWVKVAQSCLTFCDPMDYTVHGILQARILEWV